MIIFLYGPDSYRSKEKLDQIISHYKEIRKSGLSLLYFNANQTSFFDVNHACKVSSMFAETKLIIVKNIFSSKNFQEDFLGQIEFLHTMKDVVVVYEDQEVDERLKLFKALVKTVKCQEFSSLDGKALKIWAEHQLEKYQAKFNNDALDLLLGYVGNNLWQLSNEIKKLCDFKSGQIIKKDDVQLLVSPNIEADIFKTIDSLAERNKKQALFLLQKHLQNGENALYILSMIAYQFRNLLMVKELSEKGLMYASIIKKSGLHPFVVKKTYFQCRQFSFSDLKKIYHAIFTIDSDIKMGTIDSELALELFISQI
jgi:DNA polymerase-3 subunit delta